VIRPWGTVVRPREMRYSVSVTPTLRDVVAAAPLDDAAKQASTANTKHRRANPIG
jgi:hypothetical protein